MQSWLNVLFVIRVLTLEISHSHRKTPKMWKSNVKSVRVKTESGATERMYVCTSCLRSGKVERA